MTKTARNRRWGAPALAASLALLLTVLAPGGVAQAGTETPPSASVPPTDTDFATTVSIDQFDPANGTLTSATVELVAGVNGDMFVENLSTQSPGIGQVTLAAAVTASLQADPTVGVAPALPEAVQDFTLDVCDDPDPTTVTGCNEDPDFMGPAGLTVTGLSGEDIQSATFTDPADLALFLGTGTVVFDVAAAGDSSGTQDTGNVFFEFFTQASATVTVTYQFEAPAIDIEKATNGEDADDPTGPEILVGDPVEWTYVVTNTGDVDLVNVTVVDDQGVAVTCPQDTLAAGEVMTCTASGIAEEGQYANLGTVTGDAPDESQVTDEDPSHYIGVLELPAIDIEKATNGEDADEPTGPEISEGDPVQWTYVVTNTGTVDLTNVSVVDDQGVAVTCPQDTLAVDESMTCTADGTAEVGQYANLGTTEGEAPDGTIVTDEDPSHYLGIEGEIDAAPMIEIVKDPDRQTIIIGSGNDTATWTITVTNPGTVDLINVAVTDAQAPGCDRVIGDLAAGDSTSYTCSRSGVTAGFTNVAVVTGEDEDGTVVTDNDDAVVVIEMVPTGSDSADLTALGATMVMLGAGLVLLTSRRRQET